MKNDSAVLDALKRRAAILKQWMIEEAPYVSEDQKHLVASTPEQAYWHLGYYSALADAISLLERDVSPKVDIEDISNSSRSADLDE